MDNYNQYNNPYTQAPDMSAAGGSAGYTGPYPQYTPQSQYLYNTSQQPYYAPLQQGWIHQPGSHFHTDASELHYTCYQPVYPAPQAVTQQQALYNAPGYPQYTATEYMTSNYHYTQYYPAAQHAYAQPQYQTYSQPYTQQTYPYTGAYQTPYWTPQQWTRPRPVRLAPKSQGRLIGTSVGGMFLVHLGISIIVTLIAVMIALVGSPLFALLQYGGADVIVSMIMSGPAGQWIMIAASAIPLLSVGVFSMKSAKLSLRSVVPASRVRPTDFILGVIVCLGMGLTGAYLSYFLLIPFGGAQQVTLPTAPYSAGFAVLSMISMAVVPALFEEFVFRGVLLRRLAPLGSGFAIMASALMFGMIHGTLEQITLAVFMGAAAAYFTLKWNNIWIGVVAHFINNALVVTIQILAPLTNKDALNIAATTLEIALVALALVAILILLSRHKDALSMPVAVARRSLWDDFMRSPALIALMAVYGVIIAMAWSGRLDWVLVSWMR